MVLLDPSVKIHSGHRFALPVIVDELQLDIAFGERGGGGTLHIDDGPLHEVIAHGIEIFDGITEVGGVGVGDSVL